MKPFSPFALLLFFAGAPAMFAQSKEPPPWPATHMPADRADASYAIYSSLLPLGETAGKDWPHRLWLVSENTITAVPPAEPCWEETPQGRTFSATMNPHTAIHAPEAYHQDFAEILEDFDKHCHERLTLQADAFHVNTPLRVLNETEQHEFETTRVGGKVKPDVAARYQGAAALYSFSQVYFNTHGTVAAVYATHWCGMLCGEGFWVAFVWRDGRWQQQRWQTSSWIS